MGELFGFFRGAGICNQQDQPAGTKKRTIVRVKHGSRAEAGPLPGPTGEQLFGMYHEQPGFW